ncbi:MAG: hypothetical protein KIS74_02885 [Burkholderiales bacterium]|nr:hypothetical protein [Burkholderiales bacterium]
MANPTKPKERPRKFRPRVPFTSEVAARGGQVAAAKQLGLAQTTLSQLCRGKFYPGHEVCDALGLRRVDTPPYFRVVPA